MASGFSVEPTRLAGLADELQVGAGELRQAISHFALAALAEPGLFGVLGPAPAAAARYGAGEAGPGRFAGCRRGSR
ncbi:MAG: hypothetical protein DLM67_05740 [Candidatus Nephthysia bennettiae]|uniref:hypothetical protein n=1 Tax=Candidatus Nephthysia bennettiae TaxID=3127016 RepID=UPI000DAF4C9C|nr:hypothetical protein [Candidatus Dormibacteraeota bacterium]PZR98451.1 MAG: hypothetical protein DLM67_05740 [Candidatus Dormibacteraeota bacterium]